MNKLLAAVLVANWTIACSTCENCSMQGSNVACDYSPAWLEAYANTQFDPLWMHSARSATLYDSRGVCAAVFRAPAGTKFPKARFIPNSPSLPAQEVTATCDTYFSLDTDAPSGVACEAVLPSCVNDPVGLTAELREAGAKLAELKFERTNVEGAGDLIHEEELRIVLGMVCDKSSPDPRTWYLSVRTTSLLFPGRISEDKSLVAGKAAGWIWVTEGGKLACVGAIDCLVFRRGNASRQPLVGEIFSDLQMRWIGVSGIVKVYGDADVGALLGTPGLSTKPDVVGSEPVDARVDQENDSKSATETMDDVGRGGGE